MKKFLVVLKSFILSRITMTVWVVTTCLCVLLIVIGYFNHNHVLGIIKLTCIAIILIYDTIVMLTLVINRRITNSTSDKKKTLNDHGVKIDKSTAKVSQVAKVEEPVLGHAQVKQIEHLIDLDADPFIPEGLEVRNHQKGGIFKWNPNDVKLCLSESTEEERGSIHGNVLHVELIGKPVFNACLLDYLICHQYLIPENWKNDENGHARQIFFWGTTYQNSKGYAHTGVRFLFWSGSIWRCCYIDFDEDWYGLNPAAALRAS